MAVLSFPALAQEDFTVNIVTPLEFYGDEVIHQPVRRSEIERLLDKKIDDFTFTEGDRRISVQTCRQFVGVDKGMFRTSWRLQMASHFDMICGTLSAIKKAQAPQTSFIKNPKAAISDLTLLPANLLPAVTEDAGEELDKSASDGKTFADFVASKKATVREQTTISVEVAYDSMTVSLYEIARADFDGDGLEDILVGAWLAAEPGLGDMMVGSLYLFTRDKPRGPFKFKHFDQI